MRIIAPTLFKMIGRGFKDDAYAHNGIHLRWFVAPSIGFPRAPFRLWIREGIDRGKQVERVWQQGFSDDAFEDAHVDRNLLDFSLLRVYREFPHSIQHDGRSPGGLIVTQQMLFLDFRTSGGSQGVSYAEITVRLGNRGSISVEAQHRGPNGWYAVDRASAGHKVVGPTIEPPPGIPPFRGLPGRRPGGETPIAPPSIGIRELDLRDVANLFPALPLGRLAGDKFVTLSLRGDRIFRLAVSGRNASVVRVLWVPAESHANETDWDHVEDFYLPVSDPGDDWYPDWSPHPVEVAIDRLMRHPANAHDPWHTGTIPAPPGDPPKAEHYERCYVQPYVEQFDDMLQTLLRESRGIPAPQLSMQHEAPAEPPQNPDGGDPPDALKVDQTITFRPLLVLLTALYEPHFARLMGLATVQDPPDPKLSWDYMITSRWHLEELELEDATVRALRPFLTDGEWLEVASIVPAVKIAKHRLPSPPADFQARLEQQTAPGTGAVAHTRLSWRMSPRERPPAPEAIGLLHALAREGPDGLVSLNAVSRLTECRMPFIPDDHLESETPEPDLGANYGVFRDRTVPKEGTYTYRVSGSDPFGRWSPWTERAWTFVDTAAPSTPVNLRAIVIDPADPDVPDEAKAWAADKPPFSLRVQFDWPDEAAENAPDLAFFRVHVRQGIVGPADPGFQDLAQWGRIHYSAVSSTFALRFDLTGGSVSIHPNPTPLHPVRVQAPARYDETAGDGTHFRGMRYTVDLSGFVIPIGDNGLGRVSVAVSALDENGNESETVAGPAAAILIDRTPPDPVPLPPLARATYADATGRSAYELSWDGQEGVRYAVWRGVETRLLDVASLDQQDAFAAAPTVEQRGEILRQIAAEHFHALVRLNQELVPPASDPAPASSRSYTDELPGYTQNLYVYTVVGSSVTGVDGPSPASADDFVAVEIPQRRTPAPPAWRRLRSIDAGVELMLKLDQSTPIGAVELYRTVNQDRAEDVRQMLPIARFEGADLPALAAGETELPPLTVTDGTTRPWRRYYYRAVARAEADHRGVLGARSAPSPVGTVLTHATLPPPAPTGLVVTEIVGPPGHILRLSWTSTVPYGPVEQGVFRFAIWRRGPGENHFTEIAAFATNDTDSEFVASPPAPTPPGTDVPVEYTYFDELPAEFEAEPVSYRVRVSDPVGRFANSAIVTFSPVP